MTTTSDIGSQLRKGNESKMINLKSKNFSIESETHESRIERNQPKSKKKKSIDGTRDSQKRAENL